MMHFFPFLSLVNSGSHCSSASDLPISLIQYPPWPGLSLTNPKTGTHAVDMHGITMEKFNGTGYELS